MTNEHDRLVDRAARRCNTVMFIGGMDAGKSTLARATAAYALRLNRSVAYIDADIAQKTVGPPGTIGMKLIHEPDDLTHDRLAVADTIGFVGTISPEEGMTSVVGALGRLSREARDAGADLVVIDTSGLVTGVWGETLKYYKVAMLRPDLVVALQRGQELEPVTGILQRFFGVEVASLGIHPAVVATSVEERIAQREHMMERYFQEPLQRFRVKPTVFMPALPPFFDLAPLDRLMVGLSDGRGGFMGIGFLEYIPADGGLRLVSPVAEAPKALRLGAVRIEDHFRIKKVDLGHLLGTD